jgi:hypothetical protein
MAKQGRAGARLRLQRSVRFSPEPSPRF